MTQGYLALVLHAHLPYVRHPEYDGHLEERWLYEAITEVYIPLLGVLEGLVEDHIDFRLTLSLSPPLVSMLRDELLRSRYEIHLDRLCDLAEREVVRTRRLPEFHPSALMYRDRFTRVREDYRKRWQGDLLSAFIRLQELGKLEIIACAATHGFLPLLRSNPGAVRGQVFAGVQHYIDTMGRNPAGFWLPECGFYPGLNEVLKEAGIRYFFVEAHGIQNASNRTNFGVHLPIYCPCGTAAFGRDHESSKQVWSSTEGYPGDANYREYYRDIGHDLDLSYIGPYIHKDGIRTNTGIKYFRVTGPVEKKEPYVRENALARAAVHAGDFLARRMRQVEGLNRLMGRHPIIVAPYDAELFGHWWFEGPDWLNCLLRQIAEQDTVRLTTPSQYLAENPVHQVAMPGGSSWGYQGHNQVWLNASNDWIYPHLHAAADRMVNLAREFPAADGTLKRALNQAARELLLAQASDWAFIMTRKTVVDYAVRRTKSHIERFNRLHEMLKLDAVDDAWLAAIEFEDNIFPNINYAVYHPDYQDRGYVSRPFASKIGLAHERWESESGSQSGSEIRSSKAENDSDADPEPR